MDVSLTLFFWLWVKIQIAILNAHHGVTVKDVPARDFIEAFAKHLKKGAKIKIPVVSPPSAGLLVVDVFFQLI